MKKRKMTKAQNRPQHLRNQNHHPIMTTILTLALVALKGVPSDLEVVAEKASLQEAVVWQPFEEEVKTNIWM